MFSLLEPSAILEAINNHQSGLLTFRTLAHPCKVVAETNLDPRPILLLASERWNDTLNWCKKIWQKFNPNTVLIWAWRMVFLVKDKNALCGDVSDSYGTVQILCNSATLFSVYCFRDLSLPITKPQSMHSFETNRMLSHGRLLPILWAKATLPKRFLFGGFTSLLRRFQGRGGRRLTSPPLIDSFGVHRWTTIQATSFAICVSTSFIVRMPQTEF